MKKAIVCLALSFSVLSGLVAQETENKNHRELLRLVDLIRRDPVSEDAREYYTAAFAIIAEDKDISVALSADNLPWSGELKQKDQRSGLLLMVFAVGNAEAQVRENKFGDNPYAGTLFAIAVYEKMKEADNAFEIKTLEELIVLEKAGKLKNYFKPKKTEENQTVL